MDSPTNYVVIADPQSLRWEHYQCAIQEINPPINVQLLPWRDVVDRDGDVGQLLPQAPSLLRVESPARDFSLVRSLMQAGQRDASVAVSEWIPPQKGWIASPRFLYRGLCRILNRVNESVREHGRCVPTSSLADTQVLFDKNAVTNILKANDIPTPDAFAPESREQMIDEMAARKWTWAFVKLAYGSCASGIAKIHAGRQVTGLTTVIELDGHFHNTRDVGWRGAHKLERVIDFLIQQDATVQASIDKTKVNGDEFDVRVVVVGGDVIATVFRASHLPMTNLHLGGYRADPEQCLRVISMRAWADAMEHCRRAASLFDLAAVGIDLAFDRSTKRPSIIEINAFGDFFPNWKNQQGRTIAEIEIEATLKRHGVIK